MSFTNLSMGWPALAALLIGFAAMVPFMNTGLVVGPVANALHGADLSLYVGFLVAAIVYSALRRLHAGQIAVKAA
jgi:nucleobase:cation symporter-1, NCS1 family